MRDCTCLGTCKGKEGLAVGWRCALVPTMERHEQLTIEQEREQAPEQQTEAPRDIDRAFALVKDVTERLTYGNAVDAFANTAALEDVRLCRQKLIEAVRILERAKGRTELDTLLHRIATGDGHQLENLDMTDEEWRATFGSDTETEVTMNCDDWLELVRYVRSRR